MRRTRAGRCRCLRQLYHQGQHELRPFAATPAPKDMRKSMRPMVLAAVLGIAASPPQLAVAQSAARRDAPLGQTQPTIIGVQRAQSAKGDRSATEIQADKEIERSEKELRKKLIICRGC